MASWTWMPLSADLFEIWYPWRAVSYPYYMDWMRKWFPQDVWPADPRPAGYSPVHQYARWGRYKLWSGVQAQIYWILRDSQARARNSLPDGQRQNAADRQYAVNYNLCFYKANIDYKEKSKIISVHIHHLLKTLRTSRLPFAIFAVKIKKEIISQRHPDVSPRTGINSVHGVKRMESQMFSQHGNRVLEKLTCIFLLKVAKFTERPMLRGGRPENRGYLRDTKVSLLDKLVLAESASPNWQNMSLKLIPTFLFPIYSQGIRYFAKLMRFCLVHLLVRKHSLMFGHSLILKSSQLMEGVSTPVSTQASFAKLKSNQLDKCIHAC